MTKPVRSFLELKHTIDSTEPIWSTGDVARYTGQTHGVVRALTEKGVFWAVSLGSHARYIPAEVASAWVGVKEARHADQN